MSSRILHRLCWMVTWGRVLVVTCLTTPRQLCSGGNAQLAQQRRLFLRGRVLPPRRLRLHQTRHPEMPRIVFRQPLHIGQRQRVPQLHGLRVAAHLHHLPRLRPIWPQPGIVNLMRKMVHLCSKERTIGGFVLS